METTNIKVPITGFPDNVVRCTIPGHHYRLTHLVADGKGNLTPTETATYLDFFLKDSETGEATDGVMNEQVLVILFDRMQYLDSMYPCKENKEVIEHLHQCLTILEARRKDRVDRGVLGQHKV